MIDMRYQQKIISPIFIYSLTQVTGSEISYFIYPLTDIPNLLILISYFEATPERFVDPINKSCQFNKKVTT